MRIERAVSLEVENTIVKIAAPIAIGGRILKPGAIAELSRLEAIDLIRSRRVVAATEDEIASAAEVVKSFTIDAGTDANEYRAAMSKALRA